MSATPRTVNADRRRVLLGIASSTGNTYRLALPPDRGTLLPGPWMPFAMDAAGVPGVATIRDVAHHRKRAAMRTATLPVRPDKV